MHLDISESGPIRKSDLNMMHTTGFILRGSIEYHESCPDTIVIQQIPTRVGHE